MNEKNKHTDKRTKEGPLTKGRNDLKKKITKESYASYNHCTYKETIPTYPVFIFSLTSLWHLRNVRKSQPPDLHLIPPNLNKQM